jgi:hypothetical protein
MDEPHPRLVDDEGADALVLARGIDVGRGARQQVDEIGAIGKGTPVLAAGDDPFITIAPRPARDAGQIGAGARL